ncbi:MAG: 2-hydroxyglutaryl-CoA dehydratase [Clostridiales bacterium]|nr:2-hydroxyglutaryl-CoA dehydratase [Clostridiales bacterium]
MKTYQAGIDIGSTTVKLVLLEENGSMAWGEYRRHGAKTQETLADMMREAREKLGQCEIRVRMTGSGAISLAEALHVGFVQEVVAVAGALQKAAPRTDVAIELGGEDAKIIYFTGGLEERMNGVCAGGTGSFIDQMAALLKTDASGLNELAKNYRQLYPIAARCGVFAKSDIQPMINEGVPREDLAASIFQAVVNQTISGLACGKPIRGHVAFLGGPLHFLTELRQAFVRTLSLTEETAVVPENSHLFAATGAAQAASGDEPIPMDSLLERLSHGVMMTFGLKTLPPLFRDQDEHAAFRHRHHKAKVIRGELESYEGDCFLGIDAGSTTTKVALIGSEGQLLYSYYAGNQGSPIETARQALQELSEKMPGTARIARSCATGYGEGLLKSAFCMDEGEVETIAHTTAAAFFDPQVDCVLDIGGQDMKCIKLRNGSVDTILLNEACSSGCGSFLENFANSLGYTAQGFAAEALFAQNPVDLGTRCTVFMNSNVKQAQKQGASVQDISAGLACSVVRNALFKVIKLADAKDLGSHIVVQGGTFHNKAVLRAFEQLTGVEAVCPDISGIMGAFGAALIARERWNAETPSTMLPIGEILSLTWQTRTARCQGCTNRCMLTVSVFPGNRRHITGNRCEKGLGGGAQKSSAPNVMAYKLHRLFDYEPVPEKWARRGVIGLPRVLNMYENFPFWMTVLSNLSFRVVVSPPSSRAIYERGMESIPSESECYPAKLAHGHVQWLIDQGVKTIFYPSVFYEHQEESGVQNHYNCPMVAANPENIVGNMEDVAGGKARVLKPFVALTSEKVIADRLVRFFRETMKIPEKEVRQAVHEAWIEQQCAKADVRAEGQRALEWMERNGRKGVVLAGRPYHVDPEINHGMPELIASYGLAVLTEDSLPADFKPEHPLRVSDQWVYHSRLYRAAQFVRTREDLELIQLNSFGCGLDAVTTDQVAEILEKSGKLYTLIKIDEVNSLGAARIRVRSLLAAMAQRERKDVKAHPLPAAYRRAVYTADMNRQGYTILAPRMSPLHFDILGPVFRKHGYHVVMLENEGRSAIETGLKFVNNDACYPSIITVGQMMEAVLSGKYDTDHLALMMTQTGGCCRASNYVGFIRRALEKAGLRHIPVISVNLNGMETNPGFRLSAPLIMSMVKAVVCGDLLMRCLYRVRPYEVEKGSADALKDKWTKVCIEQLTGDKPEKKFRELCEGIVADFDALPIHEDVRKPRVGIVGEILVKYMPVANNNLVELLEAEGAEVVVPDLMDFFNYSLYNGQFQHRELGESWKKEAVAVLGVKAVQAMRRPALEALRRSRRFEPPMTIDKVARLAEPFLSIGNQYGEGWFLCGEMVELIRSGTPNIVCIQPFACLPNHVVGKGMIKQLRAAYPEANICAVDFDPGASEVNQLNRVKLMLAAARKQLQD